MQANIWLNTNEIDGDSIDNDENGYVDDVRGWDFVRISEGDVYPGEDPFPPDNDPMDFHGHGTHVAGIAGAVGNNAEGIAGVNWTVSLMPLRAGYKDASGNGRLLVSDIAEALVYAADNGAHIVNMSFGGHNLSQTERIAIDHCAESGLLLVAGAGNDGFDQPFYPAAFDEVLAVAAGIQERNKFSNYGLWVDLMAPGNYLHSTMVGGEYGDMTGTSMASPIVAGVAGLVRSVNPSWTSREIKTRLRATCTDVNAWNPDYLNLQGAGRVNAHQAVAAVSSPAKLGVVLQIEEITGNGDDLPDPGELIRLRPSVRNWSLAQDAVTVTLSSTDPFITITDADSVIGDINDDRIATNSSDPLSLQVHFDAPRDHFAALTFEISTAAMGTVAFDSLELRLNPGLRNPFRVATHTSSFDYSYPQIFARPTGGLTIVYRSNGAPNRIYARSSDSAGWWDPAQVISGDVSPAREHASAVDDDSGVHVSFMGKSGENWEIYYVFRNPADGVWSALIQISSGAIKPDTIDLKSTIAVNGAGHPHVIWLDYRNGAAELFERRFDGAAWLPEASIGEPPQSCCPYGLTELQSAINSANTTHVLLAPSVAWGGNAAIYMISNPGQAWTEPILVTETYTAAPVFSIARDTQDHLHLTYQTPADPPWGYDVDYRVYDGAEWSAPEVVVTNVYYPGRPVIAVAPDDVPQVVRTSKYEKPTGGLSEQLYRWVKDEAGWSATQWTYDQFGTEIDGGPSPLGFVLDSSGTPWIVDSVETPHQGLFVPNRDILLLTTQIDGMLLPSRPVVIDDGTITRDAMSLHASWSSSSPEGTAGYEYAIGTAPAKSDIRYWISSGTATSATVDLSNTPMLCGQAYYISVRASNPSGYESSIGTSDGIAFAHPADLDGDCDVDGDDLDAFESCASGPGVPHDQSENCQQADVDDDSDVDQSDFGVFQRCLSGEGNPDEPDCTD